MKEKLFSLYFLSLASLFLGACNQWNAVSPDGNIKATVRTSPSLQYKVEIGGQTALEWSPLGIRLSDTDFTQELKFVTSDKMEINEEYSMPHGSKSLHKNHCNQLALTFKNSSGRQVQLVFRVFNEGAAYRYVIPGTGNATITEETSAFVLPDSSHTWSMTYDKGYEDTWKSFTTGVSDTKSFPVLAKTPGDIWVLLTEAAVYGNYCACRLQAEGFTYSVKLAESPYFETDLHYTLPWETPWRVMVVGSLANIVENSAQTVDNLNPPCEIADISWIKPGRASWSAPNEGIGNSINLDQQKRYVDFSAEMGWEYCLVDLGWRNANLPVLHTYAQEKGVGLELWFTGPGVHEKQEMDTPANRKAILEQCKNWGIKSLKVDFIENDNQQTMQWYHDMAREAAEYQIMLTFHGSTLPRGLRRCFPNIMTMEGVVGEEFYVQRHRRIKPPAPEHNCILPYTRNAVGPMDYNQPLFRRNTVNPRVNTDAHELALVVVYESGIQHLTDGPESYKNMNPPVIPFLKAAPAHWDETRFLEGYPGKYICIARRNGPDWYIAGISAEYKREVKLDLGFLSPGTYQVEFYHDKEQDSQGMALETRTLKAPGTLHITMLKNGGFVCHVAGS